MTEEYTDQILDETQWKFWISFFQKSTMVIPHDETLKDIESAVEYLLDFPYFEDKFDQDAIYEHLYDMEDDDTSTFEDLTIKFTITKHGTST